MGRGSGKKLRRRPRLRFAHRLARELGLADVDEVLALPATKLDAWLAYANLEPFGPLEEERRALATALMILNAWRDKKQKPVSARKLFPRLFAPRKKLTDAQKIAAINRRVRRKWGKLKKGVPLFGSAGARTK